MDRASDYGSEGWGFDSLPARFRRDAMFRSRSRPVNANEPQVRFDPEFFAVRLERAAYHAPFGDRLTL
jgi:hypothetical protein